MAVAPSSRTALRQPTWARASLLVADHRDRLGAQHGARGVAASTVMDHVSIPMQFNWALN